MMFGPSGDEETNTMLGRVPGRSIVNKFGRNLDVDGAEDIWGGGGFYTGQPVGTPASVAETCEVFSASAADTAAGTGARTLCLEGLDENGDTQTEDVTLDGLTPVTTVGLWYRLPRAYCLTAGSGEVNAGEITVRHSTTTANVFANLPAGAGQTFVAAATVPAGHTAYLRQFSASIFDNTNNRAEMAVWSRPFGGAVRLRRAFVISTNGGRVNPMHGGICLEALTDVRMRCSGVQNNNGNIAASFDLLLVENP